jgi:hypothetical protein
MTNREFYDNHIRLLAENDVNALVEHDYHEDAVGPNGKVYSNPATNRDNPQVLFDYPFVTALSVESSIAFGEKLVEVLSIKMNK